MKKMKKKKAFLLTLAKLWKITFFGSTTFFFRWDPQILQTFLRSRYPNLGRCLPFPTQVVKRCNFVIHRSVVKRDHLWPPKYIILTMLRSCVIISTLCPTHGGSTTLSYRKRIIFLWYFFSKKGILFFFKCRKRYLENEKIFFDSVFATK